MNRFLIVGAVVAAFASVTATALAADPEVPFPAAQVQQVFIATQTVLPDGTVSNFFAPGSTVVFRSYAVDPKTKSIVGPKLVKYFYVSIPGQPALKFKYDPSAPGASKGLPWTATWTVPASFAEGTVAFKVLVKLDTKRKGQFVQMPVSTAQLTISKLPPPVFSPGAGAGVAGTVIDAAKLDLSLYVDSVAGTRPVGVPARQIGCSQTNVYKRGEQLVVRAWGTDLNTGAVLSSENVKEAHFSIAGQPDTTMNWGAHGATGAKVWFWTNALVVPQTFPLGEATVHVAYTTESGKKGAYDYVINVIPS
ncbi:MAG: hypothetical protein QOG52_2183 [Frankiaceae bacterium]|nr:hypothetical protein [Frankiaceae bacterium]